MKRLPQFCGGQGAEKYHNHAPNTTRRENVVLTGRGTGPGQTTADRQTDHHGDRVHPLWLCVQKLVLTLCRGYGILFMPDRASGNTNTTNTNEHHRQRPKLDRQKRMV